MLLEQAIAYAKKAVEDSEDDIHANLGIQHIGWLIELKERRKEDENPALTWEELEQMSKKPVWIETVGFTISGYCSYWTYWALIDSDVEDFKDGVMRIVSLNYEDLEEINEYVCKVDALSCLYKDDQDKTWKAYRKERTY